MTHKFREDHKLEQRIEAEVKVMHVITEFQEFMQFTGISTTQLAKRSQIEVNRLRDLLRGNLSMTAKELFLIADALNMKMEISHEES